MQVQVQVYGKIQVGGSKINGTYSTLPKKTVPEVPDLEEFIDLVPDFMEPVSVLCVTSAYEGFGGPSLRNT